jgi:hypothetical protein
MYAHSAQQYLKKEHKKGTGKFFYSFVILGKEGKTEKFVSCPTVYLLYVLPIKANDCAVKQKTR